MPDRTMMKDEGGGRYRLASTNEGYVLLDSEKGKAWLFVQLPKAEGGSGRQRMVWSPIGFLSADDTRKAQKDYESLKSAKISYAQPDLHGKSFAGENSSS